MVTVAEDVPSDDPAVGLLRVSVNVLAGPVGAVPAGSWRKIVRVVSPGANVSVPEAGK